MLDRLEADELVAYSQEAGIDTLFGCCLSKGLISKLARSQDTTHAVDGPVGEIQLPMEQKVCRVCCFDMQPSIFEQIRPGRKIACCRSQAHPPLCSPLKRDITT